MCPIYIKLSSIYLLANGSTTLIRSNVFLDVQAIVNNKSQTQKVFFYIPDGYNIIKSLLAILSLSKILTYFFAVIGRQFYTVLLITFML